MGDCFLFCVSNIAYSPNEFKNNLSLGAILALNYAIEHTEKVKSLVLIAPQADCNIIMTL